MVKPTIIECNICEEKILLRFQLGYYNIPFICKCPNCGISINGFQDIRNGNLIINGAKEIDSDLNQVKYYGNFSVEFLNKKITEFENIEEIIKKDFSPFMRTASLFDNIEEYSQINEKINKFMNFKLGKWGTIYSLYELLFDGRIDYIKKAVSKYSNKYNIINELDACMALHQLFLIDLHNILPEDTLGKYMDLSQKIFNPEKYTEINDFVNYVKTKVNFKVLNFKIIELYNRWITEFEKYMSVVSLCISDKLDKVDKDTFVMSTINFESMKSFYSDSYELILDLMWIPIGLNNIYERGTYNLFNDICGIENFDKYFSIKIKLNKNKALIDNEIFSIYLNTDRKIRNSISHYDYILDNSNQKVIFLDNENKVEMYIVDFAKLCYENVILITYLNELYYSLKKYDYITMGMAPNIKF